MNKFSKIVITAVIIFVFIVLFGALTGIRGDAGQTTPGIFGLILFAGMFGAIKAVWKKGNDKGDGGNFILNKTVVKDYYAILEIEFPSDPNAIKSAYKKQSMRWHPDKNPGINTEDRMKNINEAYLILKDPLSKGRYDAEYAFFKKTTSFHPNADNTYDSDSNDQRKWEYNYDIKDESLKDDINRAHKSATEGARDSVIGYAYVCVLVAFGVIGLCILCMQVCSNPQSVSPTRDLVKESSISPVRPAKNIKVLGAFQPPETWFTYRVNYGAFSISVPNTVELRNEYDAYTKLLKSHNLSCNSDVVIFQQKGLGANPTATADRHYCRIMIMHVTGKRGDFYRSNETEEFDFEMISLFKELVQAELANHQYLLETPTYCWIDIDGLKAIEIKYRRSGNNGNTTKCTMYLLFNDDEMVKMIVSYRERDACLWKKDLGNVIKTFKWL